MQDAVDKPLHRFLLEVEGPLAMEMGFFQQLAQVWLTWLACVDMPHRLSSPREEVQVQVENLTEAPENDASGSDHPLLQNVLILQVRR